MKLITGTAILLIALAAPVWAGLDEGVAGQRMVKVGSWFDLD